MMRAIAYSLTVALTVVLGSASAQAEERMLAHDVYFSLKDNSPQAKDKLIVACKKYLTDHPGTVLFAVGPLADEMKRDVNDRDFDVALHLVFTSKAAHDQYAKAERHLKFIEENQDNWKKVRVFDSYVEAFAHGPVEAVSGGQSHRPSAEAGLVAAARNQINLFNVAIQTYQLDNGGYPTTQQGLQALRVLPTGLAKPNRWNGPYLAKDVPLDPWQRPYNYRYPGKYVRFVPDIWSFGPDGIDGTADDIGSWMKKSPPQAP